MSTKIENIKNFINQIGKENQLFLFVGTNSTDTKSNSTKSEIDLWKDSDFSFKIGKDNVIGVIPNVKWVKRRAYKPWYSTESNIENYYVYNQDNGYVYLCLSDNAENRIDKQGQIVSNYIPSHTSGDYSYEDGYTWKALYRITPNLERFVTEQWIPVISFDNYEDLDKSSLYTQMQNFCYPLGTKDISKCCLYYSKNYQYLDGNGNTVNAIKGNLHTSFNFLTCTECYNLFKDHPNFVSVFSSSIPSSITIKDKYDLVGDLIQENKISISSPYYYLYRANENSPDEGYIVAAKIDLSQFNLDDLSVSKDNPELTITSNTGSGGRIRLKTYRSISNKILVNGIEIISKGSGYRDIQLTLTSADMLGSVSNATIASSIKIELDEIDGLGFDPMKVLNVKHTMIDVSIDRASLTNSNLSIPNSINFYGLVQNPKYGTSFEYVAGSSENKYVSTFYRTTTKLSVYATSSNPSPNKTALITKSNGTIIRDLKVTKVVPATVFSPSSISTIEVKGLEYKDVSSINGSITVDNTTFNIKAVESSPLFNQYTGTVLSSNKTTAINIEDEDTAIIRINMVKGM